MRRERVLRQLYKSSGERLNLEDAVVYANWAKRFDPISAEHLVFELLPFCDDKAVMAAAEYIAGRPLAP